jgi:hypothetical protein
MHPLRRNVAKRDQNKGPVLHTRVRQDQPIRDIDALPLRWQSPPLRLCCNVRQYQIIARHKIQIQ